MKFKLDYNYTIHTDLFSFQFKPGDRKEALVRQTLGNATIYMPKDFDFGPALAQDWANKILASTLKEHGKIILNNRTLKISQAHNFSINRICVKDISSRWGSCSSLKNVNLSIWLLLLPSHLIDYVIKHELTHLNHLNHSPEFWHALDDICGGKGCAKRLDKELDDFAKTQLQPRIG